MIEFTINNAEREAEEGMTWAEWVNSGYNTYGYYVTNNNYISTPSGVALIGYSKTNYVNANDVITSQNYITTKD